MGGSKQTQTTNRQPWEPAQAGLKGVLEKANTLGNNMSIWTPQYSQDTQAGINHGDIKRIRSTVPTGCTGYSAFASHQLPTQPKPGQQRTYIVAVGIQPELGTRHTALTYPAAVCRQPLLATRCAKFVHSHAAGYWRTSKACAAHCCPGKAKISHIQRQRWDDGRVDVVDRCGGRRR